jgi:hypothetical protein
MSSPKELLEEIVEMIEGDIDAMRAETQERLDARSAAKITRYSKALLEILDYEAGQRKEQKRKLSTLTEAELEKLAKEALKD